ncbi:MAG: bifunctional nuclease family protein [Chloroflexota bacterium]
MSDNERMLIPVAVDSVRMNLSSGQRVVILKDEKLDRYLLIWIGMSESTAIALELQNEKAPRPLTHDLLKTVIDELGGEVVDITVCDLNDNVFFARIGLLNAQHERVEIDARSSDAIALAVRTGVPVFVEESILNEAAITMPAEEDERLEVYRDFVNQLFESPSGEEGERRPDA